MDSTSTSLNVGDSSTNRQYRGILSFNTASIPDNATILSVTLKIYGAGLGGKNPFSTFGPLFVDIRNPFFGTTASLQVGDFQADASSNEAAAFSATPVSNWYSAWLTATGRTYINLFGTTQFRLRFMLASNRDYVADFMRFYSGNAAATIRPQLVIKYYAP